MVESIGCAYLNRGAEAVRDGDEMDAFVGLRNSLMGGSLFCVSLEKIL